MNFERTQFNQQKTVNKKFSCSSSHWETLGYTPSCFGAPLIKGNSEVYKRKYFSLVVVNT